MINISGRWEDGGFVQGVAMSRRTFARFKSESFLALACENEGLGRKEVAEELFEIAFRWEIAHHQIAVA